MFRVLTRPLTNWGIRLTARQVFLPSNESCRRSAISVTKASQPPSSQTLAPVLSKQEHRIHILGSGAVGLFLACKLRLGFPSFPLHIIRRDREVFSEEDKAQRDLYVSFQHMVAKKYRMQTVHFLSETPSTTKGKVIRNLIVTTKAFSAVDAIASVKGRFMTGTERTNILLLGNGALAIRDELLHGREQITNAKIYMGYTTHGVIRESSNIQEDDCDNEHIIQAGVGHIQLPASWGAEHDIEWTALWNRAQLQCKPAASEREMEQLLWLKLAANCVINPLTAIHRCTNGELPSAVPDFPNLQKLILEEVVLVAQKQLSEESGSILPSHEIGSSLSLTQTFEFCNQVIADTHKNKSSMLQDVVSGKQTEIDYLTGYIVKKGKQLGVPTPANSHLLEQVRDLSLHLRRNLD